MKVSALIIFFTIILTIYTAVNSYIFIRSLQWFNYTGVYSIYLKMLFWIVVAAYPFARIIERFWTNYIIELLVKVGSFWMGFMLYLFLLFLLVDVFRFVFYLIPIKSLNNIITVDIRILFTKIIYGLTLLIIITSYINAQIPRLTRYTIHIDKPLNKPIRIAAVSDIHLGTVISKDKLIKLVAKLNAQNPDIVLFAGDIFDEDIRPVVNNGLGNEFTKIQSKFGAFAITGNHEFFGGVIQKVKYLEEHGVRVLRDTSLLIDNSFYLIGRDDRQAKYSSGVQRKTISQLVSNIDSEKPFILLDHQPYNLEEAESNGVDLQISGHTHNGQLWPFNYITDAIFELSSGYLQKGNAHIIVSNGYGTWGPPLRLGNRPEILLIELKGKLSK